MQGSTESTLQHKTRLLLMYDEVRTLLDHLLSALTSLDEELISLYCFIRVYVDFTCWLVVTDS